MPRFHLVPILACGLLLACQGDQSVPSDPGRGLELTATCKSVDFITHTEGMYTSTTIERTRLKQCQTAEAAYDRGKFAQAEKAVDAILVAIYQDYQADKLQKLASDPTLEASVIEYMSVTCLLAGLVPGPECLIPDQESDLTDGTWVAVGPLGTGGLGQLGDVFGFRVDGGTGVFVFVSQRPLSTLFLGSCPGESNNDCQRDVFDVDADGTFTTITVESCESFDSDRLRHMHCLAGACEFGQPSPAPGLITCSVEPSGLRGFVYDITRPVQWVIHATPAYAATTGSKFTQFSPVVLGDMDPRARGVVCRFLTQYNPDSEGTICELFEEGTTTPAECAPFDEFGSGVPCSCASVADEANPGEASCQMNPKVPESVTESVIYTVKGKKTQGGAYVAFSSVTLAANSPERGGAKEVCFLFDPPNVTPVDCTTGQPIP